MPKLKRGDLDKTNFIQATKPYALDYRKLNKLSVFFFFLMGSHIYRIFYNGFIIRG